MCVCVRRINCRNLFHSAPHWTETVMRSPKCKYISYIARSIQIQNIHTTSFSSIIEIQPVIAYSFNATNTISTAHMCIYIMVIVAYRANLTYFAIVAKITSRIHWLLGCSEIRSLVGGLGARVLDLHFRSTLRMFYECETRRIVRQTF